MNIYINVYFLREKKREKDREELWKRMDSLDINILIAQIELGRTMPEPKILEKTPMTQFTSKPPTSLVASPNVPQSVKDRTQQQNSALGGSENVISAINAPQQITPAAHPHM